MDVDAVAAEGDALPPPAKKAAPSLDDDDWEICNDEGFIYKRRRRQNTVAELQPPSPALANADADLRRRQRSRRRRCLLGLREKYMRELEQWESLCSALHRLTTTTAPSASAAASESSFSPPTHPWMAEVGSTQTLIDDLLSQVEAQETVLKKLSEICDYVESVCKKQEESLMESLLELPIWGSPRCLMIYDPTNPKGAERLPPGIVVSELDFYQRRLWGNPDEDLPFKPKYLVTFTVGYGQKDNVNAAVQKVILC